MHTFLTARVFFFALFSGLLVWRVYAKFKNVFVKQRLSSIRISIRVTLVSAILVLISMPLWHSHDKLLLLGVFLALGGLLSLWGIRTTTFQAVKGVGFFYVPNKYIEIPIVLLFIARIAYRFYDVYIGNPNLDRSFFEFSQSIFTLAAFGLSAGYYISYALGLARWRAKILKNRKKINSIG